VRPPAADARGRLVADDTLEGVLQRSGCDDVESAFLALAEGVLA
jgi:hypothetical protein